MGRRSGQARRRLDLERVTGELPPLDTPEHIRANYELIQRWGECGLLPGTIVNGLVRAADVALWLFETQLDLLRLKWLVSRIVDVERDLG